MMGYATAMYVDHGRRSRTSITDVDTAPCVRAGTDNSSTDNNNRCATPSGQRAARSIVVRDLRIGLVHGGTTVVSCESNEQ